MEIRPCAAASPAFRALLEAYENRESRAERIRASGGRVAATLGGDVPEEALLAAGLTPCPLIAVPAKKIDEADGLLELAFDPLARGKYRSLARGVPADVLVASNSGDAYMRLYFYLRELARTGASLPPMTCVDWMHTKNATNPAWNAGELERFIHTLSEWTGKDVLAGLEPQWRICEEDRAAMRLLLPLRRSKRLSGTETLVAFGASFFMDKAEHTELVRTLATEAESWPEYEGLRVFITGSPQEDAVFFAMAEAAGCVITGDDMDWGERACAYVPEAKTPLESIVERVARSPSPRRSLPSQRAEWLVKASKLSGAEAVISFSYEGDEATSWDIPTAREELAKQGIALLALEKQTLPPEDATECLRTLIADVRAGGIHG